MLPSVIKAYEQEGWRVRLGSPRLRTTGVHRIGEARYTPNHEALWLNDWGFTVRDFQLFWLIGREISPRTCLIIGNAYGVSAVSIAEALKPISVDVIDAEVLGEDSRRASDVTRRVARRLGLDLRLTAGFSPQDLDKACRHERYDLVFIDGDHTNEQIVKDFRGMLPRLADRCAIVFHDVGNLNMDEGWEAVKREAAGMGLKAFDLTFTDFGDTILLRQSPTLEAMFAATCPALRAFREVYHAGFSNQYSHSVPGGQVHFVSNRGKVAFYGAGADLEPYRRFIEQNPRNVTAILDDDRRKWGTKKHAVPIVDPASLPSLGAESVIVATRSHELQVRVRLAQIAPDIPVLPLGRIVMPLELHVQEPAPAQVSAIANEREPKRTAAARRPVAQGVAP